MGQSCVTWSIINPLSIYHKTLLINMCTNTQWTKTLHGYENPFSIEEQFFRAHNADPVIAKIEGRTSSYSLTIFSYPILYYPTLYYPIVSYGRVSYRIVSQAAIVWYPFRRIMWVLLHLNLEQQLPTTLCNGSCLVVVVGSGSWRQWKLGSSWSCCCPGGVWHRWRWMEIGACQCQILAIYPWLAWMFVDTFHWITVNFYLVHFENNTIQTEQWLSYPHQFPVLSCQPVSRHARQDACK